MQRVARLKLVCGLVGLAGISLALGACVTPQEPVKPDASASHQSAETTPTAKPADAPPAQAESSSPASAPGAVANEPVTPPAPVEAAGGGETSSPPTAPATPPAAPAASQSAALFTQIAVVLQHPRCLNCHVNGDSPKQGDERRVHMPQVERGADGRGTALKCKMCHTDRNGPVAPGAPDWRLPPVEMAWEGLSAGDLCRALTDQSKNGGRDAAALVKHLSEDPLVLWGWTPGGARKPAPVAQVEFAQLVQEWVNAGAGCP